MDNEVQQVLELVAPHLAEVMRHRFGEVIVKVQDGKAVVMEKRVIYKPMTKN